MSNIIEAVKRISNILAALVFIMLIGLFVFEHYFSEDFSLLVFFKIQRIWIITLAIGLLVFLPTLLVAKFPIILRVLVFFVATPFCCWFSYLTLALPPTLLDTVELNDYRYYIVAEGGFLEPTHTAYYIYKCNIDGFECEKIYTDMGGASIDEVDLIADVKLNEVRALRHGFLIYADGAQRHQILESEQFKSYIYYIGVYPDYGYSSEQRTYMLYKCEVSFTSCQQLPFHYIDTATSFRFEFDNDTNEIRVYHWKFGDGESLIYSLGVEPKCYVEGCTIPNK